MKFNVKNTILYSYALILIAVLSASALSIFVLNKATSIDREITSFHLPAIELIKQFRSLVTDSRKLTNNWIYQPTKEDNENLEKAHASAFPELSANIHKQLGALEGQNGLKDSVEAMLVDFDACIKSQQKITHLLVAPEDYENDSKIDAGISVFEKEVIPANIRILKGIDSILLKENDYFLQMQDIKSRNFELLKMALFGLILLIALLTFFAGYYSMKNIITPLGELTQAVALVSKGDFAGIAINKETEIGNIVNKMVGGLKLKSDFAQAIGKGEFEKEFALLSDNDTLGKALEGMRENLVASQKRDVEEKWIALGRNEIGELLRSHNNLTDLGYALISYLTQKIAAVQGAFYVLDNPGSRDSNINIIASYAYNRKKYLSSSFKLGQGLVGQAVIENETIYRTEIPDSYSTISSGLLGDQKPKSLIIVPLVTNDVVYGVMELASLNELSSMHKKFIHGISDIIARSIFNVVVNEHTSNLLVQVQNSQQKMQVLLENASEVITIYDRDGAIKYASSSVESILGFDPNEMVGKMGRDFVYYKGVEEFEKMFETLIRQPHRVILSRISFLKKDGTKVWMEITGKNLINDRAIGGILLNSRDITAQRMAEKEQQARGKMQSLSENSKDLIMRVDLDGVISYINAVVTSLTGNNKLEYFQKSIGQADFPQSAQEVFYSLISRICIDSVLVSSEYIFPSELLGDKIMRVNAIPEFDLTGKLETVLLVSNDITVQKQNENEIKKKNTDIQDSINYAYNIQNSLMPSQEDIRKHLPDSFMVYKPRDIVSGDYPWLYVKDEVIYIAAVDCTGHGVPGALLSLIGYFNANEILIGQDELDAGEILDNLHANVVRSLKQDDVASKINDGMDVALCKINLKKMEMHFAGANRPLYFMHDGILQEIKANKQPIGGTQYGDRDKYLNHCIKLRKGDSVLFNTDGLPDQFGGPKIKKFGPARVREFLEMNKALPMSELGMMLSQSFEEWKGQEEQTDDVLAIGIKF